MSRRGPRLKIVRRLGTPLPGLTRKTAERRPYPPGAHGLARRRQRSDHARRLEEKQKVRLHYGVTERQLGRYFATASRRPGATGAAALALLERRLDNVVFRLGFALTVPAARQLVGHGHVRVNGRRVDRPGFLVDIGDTITLAERARRIPGVAQAIERGPEVRLPSFLALEPTDAAIGRVRGRPLPEDIPLRVDAAKIVELYAR